MTAEEKKAAGKCLELLEKYSVAGKFDIHYAMSQLEKSGEQLDFDQNLFMQGLLHIARQPRPNNGVVRRIIEVCAVLSECTDRSFDMFAQYLLDNGQVIFEAHNIRASIIALNGGDAVNWDAESKLDQLFFKLLGLESYSDENMLEKLRTLDLATVALDVTAVNQLARDEGFWFDINNPVGTFFKIMASLCRRLRKKREFHMNSIALAETFGVLPKNLSLRIYKFNEYRRLGASLSRQTDAIINNLTGNLHGAYKSSGKNPIFPLEVSGKRSNKRHWE